MVWCEQEYHPFSEASVPPSVLSSSHTFLQIILVPVVIKRIQSIPSFKNLRRPLPSLLSDSSFLSLTNKLFVTKRCKNRVFQWVSVFTRT